jgi:O-antigen/teichoic acid export membrane protein
MSEKRQLLSNSLAMLINKLTQGISSFVLTASIGRTLGAYSLGQYLLAVSYYYIFVNIASQGFRTLFTRELARDPEKTSLYLVSGTLLQFVFSIIGYLAMVILIYLLPYSADTSLICYITGLTIIPFALSNITEAIFQAQEKMHLIAISTVPIYILRLLVMLWVMHLNYGIEYVSGILVLSELLIWVVELLLIINITKPQWKIQPDFMWATIKAARTFFVIEAAGIVSNKLEILILSFLGNEVMVGIYGAIAQLIQPYFLIVSSVVIAAFPKMSKSLNTGREQQRKVTEDILEILLYMSLPFMIGLWFIGGELLQFVYNKPDFNEATMPLNIVALTLISFPIVRSFNYLIVASGYEKFNLIEATITTLIGGISGVILVYNYQLMGAAFMKLMISLSSFFILMYVVYSKLFILRIGKIIFRPVLISITMAGVFLVCNYLHINLLFKLIISTSLYIVLTGILAIHLLGGYKKVLVKFKRN